MARQICHVNTGAEGYIPIVALSPTWEQAFAESLVGQGGEIQFAMAPSAMQEFINEVSKIYDNLAMQGDVPVLLTSPAIRPYVRSIIERFRSSIVVMSQSEIHPKVKIKTLGQL